MTKETMKRVGEGLWTYRNHKIERREYIMPYVHTSYRITNFCGDIDNVDLLKDARELIDLMMEPDDDQ